MAGFFDMKTIQNPINDENLIELVKTQAYLIYLTGINNGDATQDWLDAQRLVKSLYRYIYFIPRINEREEG